MAAQQSVRVALGERSYDIDIGAGLLAEAGSRIAARAKLSRVLLVTDENVRRPHAEQVADSLAASGAAVEVFVVEAGEESKSVGVAAHLWEEFLAVGADRKSVVVAIGGGVVGDLAGFVAATFARGLPFVQIPTTLLSQVDSSVGGKVGINLSAAKNMVGAFWQPRYVLIDSAVLATLPDREYHAGLAEVVKYGVILDEPFFAWQEEQTAAILARDGAAVHHLVARSCRLKADVVERDEREETGLRAVLNYGHTFAHAVEAVAGYGEILHGEAVAMGMMCAARLARSLGRVDEAFVARQQRLLEALGLPTAIPDLPADDLLAVMQSDKKVEHGQLRFVLPTRMGHVELVGGVSAEQARAALWE